MRRSPLIIAALLVICHSLAHADLTVVEEISGAGPQGQAMTATLKFKGPKLRMDVGKDVSLLLSGSNGDLTTLIHQQKMAMPIPASMREMAGQLAKKQAAQAGDSSTGAKFAPTGQKETIAGFACDEFVGVVNGQKMNVWITREIPDYKTILAQMEAIAPEMKQQGGGLAGAGDLDGFPMRTEVQSGEGGKFTSRVISISRDPISDAEFAVPTGYRSMQIPQIPGLK